MISVKKSDFEVFDALDIDSSSVSGSQISGQNWFLNVPLNLAKNPILVTA